MSRTWLIIGIGAGVSRATHAAGHNVVATDVDRERLEQTYGQDLMTDTEHA